MNKRGGLSQIMVTIFLVALAIYLLADYRINVLKPTKDVIRICNEQILEMDKALN